MRNVISLRGNLQPEKLCFEDALRLTFPNFKANSGNWPKREWDAGIRPRPDRNSDQGSLLADMDIMISELSEARDKSLLNKISLLSKNDLASRGISCPYYYTRLCIAYAVNQAKNATAEHEFRKETRSKSQDELISTTERALASVEAITSRYLPVDVSELSSPTGRFGHAVKRSEFYAENQRNLRRYKDLTKAAISLNEIIAGVKAERDLYVKTGSPDVWVASFITAIGQVWTSLVGQEPTAKGRFRDFLTLSYSVINNGDSKSGSRRIETALACMPPEGIKDADYNLIPLRDLLLCEIFVSAEIKSTHAEAIRQAVAYEDENPSTTIQMLQETGELPPPVSGLLEKISWTIESQAAEMFGIPLDIATESKQRFDLAHKR